MALFQKSVLQQHLKTLDKSKVSDAYKLFTAHFHNATIQRHIRESKEEQYQGEFLIDLFVNVLGYTKNPQPNFNLQTEQKNETDSKKADGAILKDGTVIAVIELKGTNTTDLNTVTAQAFNYKNNQKNCKYVITSNFEKLRFYIDNAIDFEEFDLFTLTEERFSLLYLCLHLSNLLSDVPEKIKQASTVKEENVTKQLYKDYSEFKRKLFADIAHLNPQFDRLVLFKKSQKLLDRILFILFAEDRGLMPPNSINTVLNEWEQLQKLNVKVPLYDRFKNHFNYLNTGYKSEQYEIFAYNGGLFAPDEILDNILISDNLLYNYTPTLSKYDYDSEVDVNVLGHIFEHSLNDIEEVQAEIEGTALDKTKTKRKKDGVFYTPKYITKYIVDNTVGALCKEKRDELGIIDDNYTPDKRKTQKKELLQKLDTYQNWLLQITIVDPACGSGAFLNQALDFLIQEHSNIDALRAQLLGETLILPDHQVAILENNIFGVDLNEESVEIARLSLWLRTAQKGRKLNSLNNNIKCGNSLIDDASVAGEKAFNWQQEFPEIFAKGGFDVVIGNPPYVKLETIKDASIALESMKYETFDKRGDLYVLFVEKGFQILKQNGYISYIMPNKWLQAGYGEKLRKYFLTKQLLHMIDFGDMQIFEGATTYPVIFTARQSEPNAEFMAATLTKDILLDFNTNVNTNTQPYKTNEFSGDTWVISSNNNKDLLQKLSTKFKTLKSFVNGEANYGIKPGLTEAFIIDETTKSNITTVNPDAGIFIKNFVQGRDVKRYETPNFSNYIIIIEKGFTKSQIGDINEADAWNWFSRKYPALAKWLESFTEKAKNRTDKGDFWWELRACDYYQDFLKPKIMYQKFQVKPCFIYDESGLYCNDSMWIIPTDNKALLAVLNSKMGWWLITKYCTQIQNGCQLIWKYFGQIPIPEISKESALYEKADIMLSKNKELQNIKTNVIKLLESRYAGININTKLNNWNELSYKDFCKELEKQKIKLSISEQAELMQYFEQEQAKANAIQQTITQTDKEIDQMVYKLYELTAEEINIIEQA